MKAPKKIYIIPHTLTDGFCHRWFEEPFKVECIEYTRTDVLIEKAVKYVANHFLAPGMDNEINNFVNYMKGEKV